MGGLILAALGLATLDSLLGLLFLRLLAGSGALGPAVPPSDIRGPVARPVEGAPAGDLTVRPSQSYHVSPMDADQRRSPENDDPRRKQK